MTLHDLMAKYGSDKAPHGYCEFYETFFCAVREDVKSVLEIGVADGASIRAWLDYFPNATVSGLEAPGILVGKYGNSANWPIRNERFFPFFGDQADRPTLARLVKCAEGCPWDIVIDDGGHTMEQQQVSLGVLFPHTRMFYVVEDLHTSFMDEITIYDPNGPKRSYPTFPKDGLVSTYDIVKDLASREDTPGSGGTAMTDAELARLWNPRPAVHIFDRDGDHKHMTSVLEVK